MKNATLAGKLRLGLLLSLSGLLLVAPVKAQDQVPQDQGIQTNQPDQNDPPSRVARLSYLDGSVSLQPGGEGDWGSAARNRPITIGDKLWSDKGSRAELQAGQASIHLGAMTALSFLNLDENITQMRLAEGSVNFRVRELREGDLYEVDTPNVAFTVKQAGAFRIDVSENGDGTRITALRGEGEVAAGGKTYEIHAGERGEFSGTDDNVNFSVDRAPGPDGLDRWASDRDLKEDDSVSARYVSRDTPGYSDLDDNGTWSEQPEYGHVWYPNAVDPGWAPYSDGYWASVGPWGPTWIGYEPWGFAPYHYGRWAFIGSRWGWCPGPYYVSPFYGPAFVGFFGGGFGGGFGFGFGGGIGWFPLGFGEPFRPWFRGGRGFVNNINIHNTVIHNTTIINNNHFNYAYAHNTRAVTVASRSAFTNGQRINRGATRVTEASLRGAQVTNNPGVNPARQSHFGAANTGARVARPPTTVQNRPVMARTAPAAAASHMPVRTINTRALTPGRAGSASANGSINSQVNGRASNSRPANGGFNRPGPAMNGPAQGARDRQLSQNRPPSARGGASVTPNGGVSRGDSQRVSPSNSQGGQGNGGFNRPGPAVNSNRPPARAWDAQGNATDRGRAPQGVERNNAPAQTGRPNGGQIQRNDRPSGAGSGANAPRSSAPPSFNNSNRPANGGGNRSYAPPQRLSNAPTRSYSPPSRNPGPSQTYSAPQRTYSPPQRNEAPARTYSAPPRSYSAPSRTYSAPSRSYPAPSRSYSAPSRSSGGGGGGGGGNRGGGGGGAPHGGGGGGGSASHGHR